MKHQRSPLTFMLVSGSIAFVIAAIIAIATGWGLADTILLSLSSIVGGAVIGAAIHLEHYYGKNSAYVREAQDAIRKRLQLVKDAISESPCLKSHLKDEGENSITVTLYNDSTLYHAFSAKVTLNSVIFSTVMLDRSTGRRIARDLTMSNIDNDDIRDNALRHLNDPNFFYTLVPLTREVRVKA